MKCDQFNSLSCYEEFEIQSTLLGISKIDVLKEIGHRMDDYYFFMSLDGLFNWYDLNGNHINDPGILKELKEEYILKNITKCVIPDSVTSIGKFAFYVCELLKEITIPNSVTHIDEAVFSNCYLLEKNVIPNSVTSIDNYAFYRCTSLKEITIPDSVIRIGPDAFYRCESLARVVFKGKTLKEVKQMAKLFV